MAGAQALLLSLVGSLLFAGCALIEPPEQAAEPEPSAEASTTATPTRAPSPRPDLDPAVLPTGFDADAATTFDEENVYDGLVVEDRVVTMTIDRIRARALPELGPAWDLSPDGAFVDLALQDGFVYALDTLVQADVGSEVGDLDLTVRRISPGTGSVLDETTASVGRDLSSTPNPTARIVAVVGDLVLVETWDPEAGPRRTLLAIALDTGQVAWRARPATLVAATDEAVVYSTASAGAAGRLVAVAAQDGTARWTALPGLTDVRLVGADDTHVVLVKEDATALPPRLVRLALAGGGVEVLADADSVDWGCLTSDAGVAVCSLPDDRTVGVDLAAARIVWRLPTKRRYGVQVTSVTGDLAYGHTADGRAAVLDATTGRDLGKVVGAAPASLNGYGGLVLFSGRAVFYPALEPDTDAQ